jgi:hypothetical protein
VAELSADDVKSLSTRPPASYVITLSPMPIP